MHRKIECQRHFPHPGRTKSGYSQCHKEYQNQRLHGNNDVPENPVSDIKPGFGFEILAIERIQLIDKIGDGLLLAVGRNGQRFFGQAQRLVERAGFAVGICQAQIELGYVGRNAFACATAFGRLRQCDISPCFC